MENVQYKIATKRFYVADDVAGILGISKSKAYKVIKELNEELSNNGKIVIAGKISKRYFEEKVYM
ncbi:transcriptional regulator [Desemzia sp. FAM 24101]|uniref:transcriptional regulator n=1 Tax=unclassified Desemzia TaxID=2685243 RepID=UPI003888DD17